MNTATSMCAVCMTVRSCASAIAETNTLQKIPMRLCTSGIHDGNVAFFKKRAPKLLAVLRSDEANL